MPSITFRRLSVIFVALLSLLVAGAPSALAAGSGPLLAAGAPPLTRDASDASAEVTLFMLKHVATGSADADDLSLDQDILDAWAGSMATEYAAASPQEQQTLASMPELRSALRLAWPQATDAELADLRDAWRPIAEGWLDELPCASFNALAESGLVEPTDGHLVRYRTCAGWDTTTASTASQASAPATSPTEAGRRASAGLQSSHDMYVGMSNALLENHVGNMNAILNMGPSTNYHYVYSRP